MSEHTHTTYCLCKKVSAHLYGDPVKPVICSCNSCQRLTMSPYGGLLLVYPDDSFVKLVDNSGEQYLKMYTNDDTVSGKPQLHHFCSNCGVTVAVKVTKYGDFWCIPGTQVEGWKDKLDMDKLTVEHVHERNPKCIEAAELSIKA